MGRTISTLPRPINLNQLSRISLSPMRIFFPPADQPRLTPSRGTHRMRFAITSGRGDLLLRVEIDYEIPPHGLARVLGQLFGRSYAKWCTKKMVQDAQEVFPGVK